MQVRNLVSSSPTSILQQNLLGEKAHRLGRKPRTVRGRITPWFPVSLQRDNLLEKTNLLECEKLLEAFY